MQNQSKKEYILNIIKSIRESFGSSISVYKFGNCYQFYEILKSIFPETQPIYDGNHVWAKIDECFYDIMDENYKTPISKDIDVESLSKNKWSDERRNQYNEQWISRLKSE